AVPLPRRHLLDGARLQPVLRAAPPGLRAAVALRSGLRPLLPGLPDLADLLRDPHRAQLVVGDAAVDRGAAGVKAFDRLRRCRACANFVRDRGFGLLMLPLSVLPFVAVRGDVIREHDAYLIARNSRAPLAAAPRFVVTRGDATLATCGGRWFAHRAAVALPGGVA